MGRSSFIEKFGIENIPESGMGVYAIINRLSGATYIGITNNFRRRISQHIGNLMSGQHTNERLQAEWMALGASAFEFRVMEATGHTPDRYLEIEWMERIIRQGISIYNEDAPTPKQVQDRDASGRRRAVLESAAQRLGYDSWHAFESQVGDAVVSSETCADTHPLREILASIAEKLL